MATPPIQRASRVAPTTDPYTPARMPVVTRRYNQGVQVIERGNQRAYIHEGLPRRKRDSLIMLVGAILALLLLWPINSGWNWWQRLQEDQRYGNPRTSHLDAVVGHNDSATNETHFIFLNLHGHIEIIEIPGGDASHARLFTGPTLIGDGQDLTPVTGEIRREDGRLDLIVHIQDQQIVYINDGSTFHQQ